MVVVEKNQEIENNDIENKIIAKEQKVFSMESILFRI